MDLIIHLSHGLKTSEDKERASLVFLIGRMALARYIEPVILLTLEGVEIAKKCVLQSEEHSPLRRLVRDFIDNGGAIWICQASSTKFNIKEEDLVEGSMIVGAVDAVRVLTEVHTLCF